MIDKQQQEVQCSTVEKVGEEAEQWDSRTESSGQTQLNALLPLNGMFVGVARRCVMH